MKKPLMVDEKSLTDEISLWEHSEADKGQIYTRNEVVDFMLTIIGLNENEDLNNVRILEPSCGEGEFVVAIAKILINKSNRKPTINWLMGKVLAIDIVGTSINIAKSKIYKLLIDNGYSELDSKKLLKDWFLRTDFLLEEISPDFTHVIGNPPYVRIEKIPRRLLSEYRRRFSAMRDRADLYIPFFEKSLSLLINGGKLSFICTDRWTKNIYGKSLRKIISDNYSLEVFIDLYGMDVFERDVMTYPAITQIIKENNKPTVLVHEASLTTEESSEILKAVSGKPSSIQVIKGIINDDKAWLTGSSDEVSLVRKLEQLYPSLEEVGCTVFIGAATGANKTYIVDKQSVDIENSRLLPVITANELKTGSIQWQGKYLINTYDGNGVISLENYPKLAIYLNSHKEALSNRHVAKKKVDEWFKTIDRVYEYRAKREKLLIPDISRSPVVVYDKGIYHPNNSIYYICSNTWNLHALKVVLLSNVTKIFISIYSTKIAKGHLRFQAQHLRKLRIPSWDSINDDLKFRMIHAGKLDDIENFTALSCEMYALNNKEKLVVGD